MSERERFQPLDAAADISVKARNLPHWFQPGCAYFVTFRLADSLAQPELQRWVWERDSWLKNNPRPWSSRQVREYRQNFGERFEAALDAGYGSCVLGSENARGIVETAFRHFDGERYALDDYVIMPNHVHAIVMPFCTESANNGVGSPLSRILHTWKSFTAKQINALNGTSGPLWRDENFDVAVRSEAHLQKYRDYIKANPDKARLSQCRFSAGRGTGLQIA
jgi:REP element-mobilizing transposase RayT